jgi:4a-hydroxytetrahydrobiopterin dehydratase
MSGLAYKRCIPCEGNMEPLTLAEAQKLGAELNDEWQIVDEGRLLARSFRFKDFKETMAFVNKIAAVAEAEGHHPDLSVSYNALGVELTTHAIGGLSENDFIVAAKIDALEKKS